MTFPLLLVGSCSHRLPGPMAPAVTTSRAGATCGAGGAARVKRRQALQHNPVRRLAVSAQPGNGRDRRGNTINRGQGPLGASRASPRGRHGLPGLKGCNPAIISQQAGPTARRASPRRVTAGRRSPAPQERQLTLPATVAVATEAPAKEDAREPSMAHPRCFCGRKPATGPSCQRRRGSQGHRESRRNAGDGAGDPRGELRRPGRALPETRPTLSILMAGLALLASIG